MGITIVHKSGDSAKQGQKKVALVLAGGAISGGAFKVGGLLALDQFLGNRTVTDFDIYVGISAGAFLAAPLAAGVGPIEMFRAVGGRSKIISPFKASHFYRPNWEEYVSKSARMIRDSVTYGPRLIREMSRNIVYNRRKIRQRAGHAIRGEQDVRWSDVVSPILAETFEKHSFPLSLEYLPGGIFDNRAIERYIRKNLENNGLPNHFRLLRLEHGANLYIGATNLQTAKFNVFGPDEDHSVTISQAVQASTAIPGFFRPAHLHGNDYIDGAISKTASMSVAAAKGADLIIAYNPFRPYVPHQGEQVEGKDRLSERGLLTVLNQAFRTLLHTRLHLGVEKLRLDPEFTGDIILIEPSSKDRDFFQMSPLNFWNRKQATAHGYESVKESLESQYPLLRKILNQHGFEPDLRSLQSTFERVIQAQEERELMQVLDDVERTPRRRDPAHLKLVRDQV
jgi:predicted acylesterase/phospholipase RssA